MTEHASVDRALREAHERLRAVVDASPLAILALDEPGNVTLWNAAAEQMFGWRADEVVGSSIPTIPEDLREEYERWHAMILEGEVEVALETRRPRKDGTEIDVAISLAPIRDADGAIVGNAAVTEDISERKRAETERRRLEAQMQHAQKLEGLGLLAGGIAHDFNNLLQAVLGNASIALAELPEGPARERIERIETAAQRAADLTRQLLAYAGKAPAARAPVELGELAEEMVGLLEVSVSKKAWLVCELPATPLVVDGDAAQLRQVVMNLITNASESLEDRPGTVHLRLGAIDADRAYLASCFAEPEIQPGPYAFVEVEDTGCGLDPEVVPRVFDPFYTTKFAGRGLGLAVVLGIARAHRGAVRVRSAPGTGTTFRILIPLDHSRVVDPPGPTHAAADRQDGTILVVDDDRAVRQIAAETLEAAGYAVLEAVDGAEALSLLESRGAEIDVVLLDMTMPVMSGAEAFRELRRLDPEVPILLSSGYLEESAGSEVETRAGFLQKPYRPAELLAAIERVSARRARQPAA